MPEDLGGKIRNRIVRFEYVDAAEIGPNSRNWRTHSHAQRQALREVFSGIGIAGASLGYFSKRNKGKLTLIDGHLRREELDNAESKVPVLITDLEDEEADHLLAVLDPIGDLAGVDSGALDALLADIAGYGVGEMDLLHDLQKIANNAAELPDADNHLEANPVPEMEIQPFEHFDYFMIVCSDHYLFLNLAQKLGVEKRAFTMRDGKTRKVGICRVVHGQRLLDLLGEKR